jgi:hypothetical protein
LPNILLLPALAGIRAVWVPQIHLGRTRVSSLQPISPGGKNLIWLTAQNLFIINVI